MKTDSLAAALTTAAALPQLDRYYIEMPDEHCCEAAGFCMHQGIGYERDPLEVGCVDCRERVFMGSGSDVDLPELLKSIADHESSKH